MVLGALAATKPPDPTDPADLAKPSWLDSAAYSAYKHKDVNLHTRPGFGEFSYDNFVEVMNNYPDLAGLLDRQRQRVLGAERPVRTDPRSSGRT